MAQDRQRQEQLRYILRGMLRIWCWIFAFGLPLAAFVAIAMLIGKHSQTAAIAFIYAVFITAFGGVIGLQRHQDHLRDLKQEARDKEREALDKEREARRREWDDAFQRRREATGTP